MLDFPPNLCYNKNVPREREQRVEKPNRKAVRKKIKKFQKTLDKLHKVCYNKNVARVRGAHLKRTTKK